MGMLMTRTIDLVELPFGWDKNDDNDEHVHNLFRHRTHSHRSWMHSSIQPAPLE